MSEWDTFHSDLAQRLEALPDTKFLVVEAVGAPAREVVRRRRRFGGLVSEVRATEHPYVQVLRVQDTLHAEWIGSEQIGGAFPWTQAEHDGILGLGWAVYDGPYFCPNYVRDWPGTAGDADAAAELAIRSFRDIAGCMRPEDAAVRA